MRDSVGFRVVAFFFEFVPFMSIVSQYTFFSGKSGIIFLAGGHGALNFVSVASMK